MFEKYRFKSYMKIIGKKNFRTKSFTEEVTLRKVKREQSLKYQRYKKNKSYLLTMTEKKISCKSILERLKYQNPSETIRSLILIHERLSDGLNIVNLTKIIYLSIF